MVVLRAVASSETEEVVVILDSRAAVVAIVVVFDVIVERAYQEEVVFGKVLIVRQESRLAEIVVVGHCVRVVSHLCYSA